MIKFDKKTVDGMLSLPDDKLAQLVRLIAASSGTPLGEGQPDAKTLKGLRALLTEVGDGDIVRAAELLDIYRNGKKK